MSFSYDLTLTSLRDQVRLLIHDTAEEGHQLENEEVDFFLATGNNSVFEAAALACEALAARFSSMADKQVGDLKISFTNKQADYLAMAARYSDRAGSTGIPAVAPYAGGMTYADKSIDETDDDIVPPAFRIGQFENPWPTDPRVK